MKKIILATLAVFTFVGLVGCSNEKKLSAEQAKTEIKAAQENTAKAIKEGKAIDITSEAKLKATASAKNIKIDSSLKDLIPEIKTAKGGIELTAKGNVAGSIEQMKAKATADLQAKVNYDYTMGDKTEKKDYEIKGNGALYVVNGEEKFNVYAQGDATLPEDLAKMAKLDKNTLSGKINIAFEKDEDDEDITTEDVQEAITSLDFDTLIKDWTIFKKKGSTLVANCSDLKAFNLGDEDEDIQAELAEIGLTLKVSKFEIGLDKNKAIKSFDFNVSLNGTVDLAKQDIETEDIIDMVEMINPAIASTLSTITINGISGTVTLDTTYSLGVKVAYTTAAIAVPEDLAKVEEVDFDDLLAEIFGFGSKAKGQAEQAAGNALSCGKNVLLEASTMGTDSFNGKVTENAGVYSVTVKALVELGELEKNPFDSNVYPDGGMTISYTQATNTWSVSVSGTIDGYDLIYAGGSFTAFNAE